MKYELKQYSFVVCLIGICQLVENVLTDIHGQVIQKEQAFQEKMFIIQKPKENNIFKNIKKTQAKNIYKKFQ